MHASSRGNVSTSLTRGIRGTMVTWAQAPARPAAHVSQPRNGRRWTRCQGPDTHHPTRRAPPILYPRRRPRLRHRVGQAQVSHRRPRRNQQTTRRTAAARRVLRRSTRAARARRRRRAICVRPSRSSSCAPRSLRAGGSAG